MQPDTDTKPWYKQLWPWVLLGLPASSIVYSAVFITMAVTSENSMVTDEYYKEGLAINQTLERDNEASRRGLSAEYQLEDSNLLKVRLKGGSAVEANTLILRMIHPTLDDRDALVRLSRTDGNQFQARLPSAPEGRWYLDLRDASDEWRLYGAARFPSDHVIEIAAPRGGEE